MTDNEHLLNEYQQNEAAQRIIHDAELLRRGAVIAKTGRLLLSNNQLEFAQLTDDPLYDTSQLTGFLIDRSEPETTRPYDGWLSQDIATLWHDRYPYDRSNIANKAIGELRRGGAKTVRDIFLLGKERIAAIQGVGVTVMKRVEDIVATNEFDLAWLANPTIEDMHQVSTRLSQVPAAVLHNPSDNVRSDLLFKGRSIVDILEIEPQVWQQDSLRQVYDGDKIARDSYERAAIFALKYDADYRAGFNSMFDLINSGD